jgi:hypothetical protein
VNTAGECDGPLCWLPIRRGDAVSCTLIGPSVQVATGIKYETNEMVMFAPVQSKFAGWHAADLGGGARLWLEIPLI